MIFYCCLCTSFPYDFDHERAREVANGSGRISLIMLQHSRNIKHLYRPYIIKTKINKFISNFGSREHTSLQLLERNSLMRDFKYLILHTHKYKKKKTLQYCSKVLYSDHYQGSR